MRLLATLFLLIGLHSAVHAQEVASSESRRGFFTFGTDYSLWKHRLLNADGKYAAMNGSALGIHLDIALWNSSAGDFRIFSGYRSGNVQGSSASDKMDITEFYYGLKILTAQYIYVQAAYGEVNQKITTSVIDANATNNLLMIGAGLEFGLFGNWGLTIGGDFRSNPIRSTGNMSGHSHSDAMSFNIGLMWSPPFTVINTVIK